MQNSKLSLSASISFDELPEEGNVTSEQLEKFSAKNGMLYVAENTKLWKARRLHKKTLFHQDVSDGLPAFSQDYKDIIYFSLLDLPSVIYTSSDLLGMKSSMTVTCIFPDFLPTLIIKPKKRSSPLLDLGLINFSKDKPVRELTLEGDFSKEFTVYSDGQYAIEALTVLGPDFMAHLQDNIGNFNIVIFKNTMSINFKHKSTKASYIELFSIANLIIAPVKKEIMNLNVIALNDQKGIADSMSFEPGYKRNRKSLIVGLLAVTLGSIALLFFTGSVLFAIIISWCVYLWLVIAFFSWLANRSHKNK